MRFIHRHRFGLSGCLLGVAIAASSAVIPSDAESQQPSLEGTWRGGGIVALASGAREQARCQASFRRQGGSSFGMTATCATSDARIKQTATLERSGPNRFVGDFFNPDYGISGTIRVTLNGNSLTAALQGDSGSAILNLNR